MASLFDGPAGWLIGQLMARLNAGAEREAAEILAPIAGERLLVIGFGPGVGLQALDARHRDLRIVGADPSAAMLRATGRRNRDAVAAGRITLVQATLDQLDLPPAGFDAAMAVHSLQFCRPLASAAAKLAHLLRPGGRLVSITHGWAMARHAGSVEAFLAEAQAAFADAGFVAISSGPARAERGRAIRFSAERGAL